MTPPEEDAARDWIAEAVADFRDTWARGGRPRLEDLVPAEDEADRLPLLGVLARAELEARLADGEPARVEDYLDRFPELRGRGDCVLALLVAEWDARRERDASLSLDEYHRRFPSLAPELERRVAPPAEVHFPKVPGYEILAEVGRGSRGVVYEARPVGLARRVAIQLLTTANVSTRRRFLADSEVQAAVDHPNVLRVVAVGEADGVPYRVTEFTGGGTFEDRLAAGPLAPREAAAVVEGVARGAHVLHQAGFVARTLRPADVLFAEEDGGPVPKVAEVAAAGDVPALGYLLARCLAPMTTVPAELSRICRKAQANAPARRYDSALELADDLRSYLDREASRGRPRSHRALATGLAAGVVVAAALLANWAALPGPRLEPERPRPEVQRAEVKHRPAVEKPPVEPPPPVVRVDVWPPAEPLPLPPPQPARPEPPPPPRPAAPMPQPQPPVQGPPVVEVTPIERKRELARLARHQAQFADLRGDPAAVGLAREAVRLEREIGDDLPGALELLADLLEAHSQGDEAEPLYAEALECRLGRESANRGELVASYRKLGERAVARNDLAAAERALAEALRRARALEEEGALAEALLVVGGLHQRLGRVEAARAALDEVKQLAEKRLAANPNDPARRLDALAARLARCDLLTDAERAGPDRLADAVAGRLALLLEQGDLLRRRADADRDNARHAIRVAQNRLQVGRARATLVLLGRGDDRACAVVLDDLAQAAAAFGALRDRAPDRHDLAAGRIDALGERVRFLVALGREAEAAAGWIATARASLAWDHRRGKSDPASRFALVGALLRAAELGDRSGEHLEEAVGLLGIRPRLLRAALDRPTDLPSARHVCDADLWLAEARRVQGAAAPTDEELAALRDWAAELTRRAASLQPRGWAELLARTQALLGAALAARGKDVEAAVVQAARERTVQQLAVMPVGVEVAATATCSIDRQIVGLFDRLEQVSSLRKGLAGLERQLGKDRRPAVAREVAGRCLDLGRALAMFPMPGLWVEARRVLRRGLAVADTDDRRDALAEALRGLPADVAPEPLPDRLAEARDRLHYAVVVHGLLAARRPDALFAWLDAEARLFEGYPAWRAAFLADVAADRAVSAALLQAAGQRRDAPEETRRLLDALRR